MAREIIVGYDGSECSRAALAAAVETAAAFGDKIVLVFGYEPYRMGGEIQDHRKALEERGEEVTKEALELAKAGGVEAEAHLVDRGAAEALIAEAELRDARMIVIGTYGDSPLKGAILGSTPHKLLHVAEVPVLVVPASR
jgi:nucleotide-binding universal stress UspA family protein